MQLISNPGGSACFSVRLVRHLIQSQRLFSEEDRPLIALPVYMDYPLDRQAPHIATAIRSLLELGA